VAGLYQGNELPTELGTDGRLRLRDQVIGATDGVLQIIVNPQNPLRAIVTVTGQTPEAVMKAARALAGPPSLMKLGGRLALVTDVRPPTNPATSTNPRQTFASLGYSDIIFNGTGQHSADIKFSLPLGAQLSEGAAVELHLDYADTLKKAQATLALAINDVPINSVTLGPLADNAPTVQHVQALIPPSTVRP